MGQIRVLPDALANQIAAGEVVERPASALKELIENSLDAGATKIVVSLEAGGKRKLAVEDNGHGMDRDDCLMALERHATSKLTRTEDLFSISTLGFRGEALPSIASVSQLVLESRHREEDVGVRLEMRGPTMLKVAEVSRPMGTLVSVSNLFFNIPARKKFLRKTETELSLMVNLVTQYSMAHIDKHFQLNHNGRDLIDVPPVKDLRERIYQHYGKEMLDELIPIDREYQWLKIKGLTATPNLLKTSRNFQFLFVNGRLVRDKVLNHAISEAYKGFREGAYYPVIFLFINLPSVEVDVNVHPAKTEVKFINAQMIHDVVRDSIRKAVIDRRYAMPYRFRDGYHAHPTERKPDPWVRAPLQEPLPGSDPALHGGLFQPGSSPAPAHSQDQGWTEANKEKTPYERYLESQQQKPEPFLQRGAERQAPPAKTKAVKTETALYAADERVEELPKIIGQFRDSYIVAEHRGDLLLVDQHVAHERILYDDICASLEAGEIERQALLVPVTLELSPAQAVVLEDLMPTIRKFGFDLDPFDGNTFIIREVPLFALEGDIKLLVTELLEKAQGSRQETTIETIIDHFAATKACKAAVKINMRLEKEKMQHLLTRLLKSSSPMFCPHGRPIILKFFNEEIEKNFLRR